LVPRTHYQLSFTARQAVVFFVVCLFVLGLSFFFGLMAGLSGREGESAAGPVIATPAPAAAGQMPASEATPGVPAAASRTRLASEGAGEPGAPAAAPTAPALVQAFEDRAAEEPTPAPTAARRPMSAPAPASGVWIQVASLASRGEAEALAGRLSRGGYHAQIAPAQTAKGRVFRVRVGPYRTEEEANWAAERLRRQEKIRQMWVVREGQ
jgi:DedD protein